MMWDRFYWSICCRYKYKVLGVHVAATGPQPSMSSDDGELLLIQLCIMAATTARGMVVPEKRVQEYEALFWESAAARLRIRKVPYLAAWPLASSVGILRSKAIGYAADPRNSNAVDVHILVASVRLPLRGSTQ